MTNPQQPYGEPSPLDGQTIRRPRGDAAPAAPAVPRRIMGIQPVLFVGMCLLALVTLVTVVLIFIGDFESQAPRVVWTVVVFLAFTGLLALDLVLARRSATPLVIGVTANTYILAVLMIAIWVRGGRTGSEVDDYDFGSGWLFAELLGIVLLTLLVVRAAAAGAWGLISLGKRSGTQFGRVLGLIAASLLGLVGVLLTLHFAIDAFGVEVGEWYWRSTVAAVVVAALAASVTVLLFWNRRNLDWQEAEARGEHALRGAPAGAVPPPSPQWPAHAQSAAGQYPSPAPTAQAPTTLAATQWPGQPPQPAGATGLLPWPTRPDGTPLPMGPDGQPVFPPGAH